MAIVVFDPDVALFGWAAPFDVYDPPLPVAVHIPATKQHAELKVTAGCKLSTLVQALQNCGMAKPSD